MAPNNSPAAAPAAPAMAPHLVGLPIQVVGPVDVGRLIRELEAINNGFLQYRIRYKAEPTDKPKLSALMERTLELNKLDILKETDRQRLQELLVTVRQSAPMLHISFSVDPSEAFIEKLMSWLRREIHPVVLMTVGLQPNIGAGCVIRSTNKYFDCSLRHDFNKHQGLLMKMLAPELEQPS